MRETHAVTDEKGTQPFSESGSATRTTLRPHLGLPLFASAARYPACRSAWWSSDLI